MSTRLLKTKENISRDAASEKLHTIADKLGGGQIELKSSGETVSMEPSEQVEFEIEVEEEKDGDVSLEIEVEWSRKQSSGEVEIQ